MKHFTLGRIDFTEFTGYRVTSAQSFNYDYDGIIGPDLLSLFNVDLDYTDARVYLVPNKFGHQAGLR
ncbi:MAG TPA: hypothetical protein VME66_02405 [Candidatus Acidoferrales bacterium]|nr:hypothetical protein [Candidatus Acidoferrales bacterium]